MFATSLLRRSTKTLVSKSTNTKLTSNSFSTVQSRQMSGVLVLAEQTKGKVSGGTLSTIGAAKKIGGDVSVLVAGKFHGKNGMFV